MLSVASLVLWAVAAEVILMSSFPGAAAEINLLPNWNAGRSSHRQATTASQGTSNCATYLDVNIHGNPDCPLDQQFFDTQTCRFVCDPIYASAPSLSSQNGIGETRPKNHLP